MIHEHYYTFLKPKPHTPREPQVAVGRDQALGCIQWVCAQSDVGPVHYDLETTSLDFANPRHVITNVGLACKDWLIGIDLADLEAEEVQPLWDWLRGQPLGGFNLGFDLAWPWRVVDSAGLVDPRLDDLQVVSDTALWFRLLATEAHWQQRWNLETLTEKVLMWPEKYLQKEWLATALVKHSLKKEDMCFLSLHEPGGYTWYCALDAEASFQAHDFFQDTLEEWGFQGLRGYHEHVLEAKIKRQITETCQGLPIDRQLLARNTEWVQQRMLYLEAAVLQHEMVAPHVEAWEAQKLAKQYKLKVSQKKTWATLKDKPWTDPDQWQLQLATEKQLKKLPTWCREFGGKFYRSDPQFSVNGQNKKWPRFNVQSPADCKWLIYNKWLDNQFDVWYRNPENRKEGGLLKVNWQGRYYEVDLTDSGELPTGGAVLTIFGEVGQLLNEYKALKKLYSDFLDKYEQASRRTGRIHAQGKILGTISGRGAGGNQ